MIHRRDAENAEKETIDRALVSIAKAAKHAKRSQDFILGALGDNFDEGSVYDCRLNFSASSASPR